ncbi:unnamed protein product [Blepharisma stoltei]|uniref:Receptor ligand binding region domain-containing protein n=1 Tax=Blepharisma stoltei TaxID=1481888 RepID=A0AAU9K4C2_9CILI|nr:unnamed protein product [Blepharisma stoltei]
MRSLINYLIQSEKLPYQINWNMIFIVYFGLIQLVHSLGDIIIYVLYSEKTNSKFVTDALNSLSDTINQSEQIFDVNFIRMASSHNLNDILDTNINFMIIDATFDVYWNRIIYEYTENNKIINLKMNFEASYDGEWLFFLHNSADQHQEISELILNFFGWTNLAIISNDLPKNVKIVSNIEKRLKNQISLKVILPDAINTGRISSLIRKIIIPDGIQMFFILEEGENFEDLIENLKKEKVYKKGAGVLAGSSSIWAANEDGLILYVEKGLENAESYSEYEILAIKHFTDMILEFRSRYSSSQQSGEFDSLLLKELFESNTYQHKKLPAFSIINIDSNQKILKGEVENSSFHFFNRTFIFPGNTTVFPKISKTEIVLSIASGSTEPNGLTNLLNSQNFLGSLYAQWVMNNSTDLLKNFNILHFETDCGANVYDFDFYYNCMSPLKDQLGVTFLSPSFSAGAVGYITIFRKLGLEIPHCGAGTRVAALSNKAEYPEYMRVITSSEYFAVIMAKSLAYFGWSNVAVIYSDKSSVLSVYKTFVQQCEILGISILNDADKRLIPQTYLRTNYTQYKHIFKNIYESKARVCVIFMENPYAWHAIEGFYDAGFREGEFVPFFYSKTGGVQSISNDLEERIMKRKKLMLGSLSAFSDEYIGDYGKQIKSEIAQAFYPQDPSYKCFSFDAFMLAAHGLDYTINKGEDIENSTILNKNLRKQKFEGCSGTISIESSNNNRNSAPINLFNFYYNTTDDTYYETSVVVYTPGSSIPFNIIQKVTWPGNSKTIPTDMRHNNFDCPFEKILVRNSSVGIGMFLVACFTIFSISGIITWIIWKKWKIVDFPKLEKPKKIKFADMMVYLVIAIDFFQYLYLGPSSSSVNSVVAYISKAISVDLEGLIYFKGTVFWIAMVFTLSAATFSIFLNIFTVTRFKNIFTWKFCVNLRYFADAILPLIGNALFIPIISFLLNIFSCTHATGDSISDTYLDKDCYQYCWKGKHLAFALLSIIAIFIYMPLTVYYRPMYQETQESLHIKTMPKYLIIKSLAQVFFVVLKKTMGFYQPEIHGFVYLVLFLIYLWIILRVKAYNYDKICLLLFITMLMVIWSVLFTSLANVLKVTFILWLCFQLTGWVAIVVWGAFKAKKIQSLIITEKGMDISILFKFMLGKVDASAISKKEINFVSKKETKSTSENKGSLEKVDQDLVEIVEEDNASKELKNSNIVLCINDNEDEENDETARLDSNRKFI